MVMMVMFLVAGCTGVRDEQPRYTYPIPASLPPHPRLYLNDAAMAELRKTVVDDPAAKAQYDAVVSLGRTALTAPLPDFSTYAADCRGAIGLCRGPFGV